MSKHLTYETPQMLEIGNAAELTLGYVNRTNTDGCDCTRWEDKF